MNILQISGGYNRIPPIKGGSQELVIYNISKIFVKFGNNVTIIDRKYSEVDKFIDFSEGIRIVRIGRKKIELSFMKKIFNIEKIGFIIQVNYLYSLINGTIFFLSVNNFVKRNANNFDIVHVHFSSSGLLLTLFNRNLRKKMIYTVHHSMPELSEKNTSLFEKIFLKLECYLMKRINKVTVLNPSSKLRIIEKDKINSKKIVMIPNGVDLSEFNSIIAIPDKKIKVLYVGKIILIKGIEYLIDAADIIINKLGYKNTIFLLVGNNNLKSEYEKKILKKIDNLNLNENIKILAFVSRDYLRDIYAQCDIFVLPSIAESFGLVITEAMASKKPVIATHTEGAKIQIKDGWNGFLIKPTNVEQLAEKIKYLINHSEERERMGANAREFAERNFDWNIITEKYLELYSTV
jgi:glycosyltransferase involved in cell wall biosynthesis